MERFKIQDILLNNNYFVKFKLINDSTEDQNVNSVSVRQEMSLEYMLQLEPSYLESIVFKLCTTSGKDNEVETGDNLRYIQLKSKEFYTNGKKMKMVQILDVTPHMLYSEYKARIEFTSMINACVSHELRNPLNSIVAKNIEKQALYEELRKLFKTFDKKVQANFEFKQCLQILD